MLVGDEIYSQTEDADKTLESGMLCLDEGVWEQKIKFVHIFLHVLDILGYTIWFLKNHDLQK